MVGVRQMTKETIYTTECNLKYCCEMNENIAEVVRCKDCIYRINYKDHDGYTEHGCSKNIIDDNEGIDYCSYGEAKQ